MTQSLTAFRLLAETDKETALRCAVKTFGSQKVSRTTFVVPLELAPIGD